MRFFKNIDNDYLLGIGTGNGGTEITETEYNDILAVIRNKPARTETVDYRLKTDLTWEVYEHDPDPEPEPGESEYATAGRILMGVEE